MDKLRGHAPLSAADVELMTAARRNPRAVSVPGETRLSHIDDPRLNGPAAAERLIDGDQVREHLGVRLGQQVFTRQQ